MKLAEDETLVLSTDPITGTAQDIGTLAIQITANDLASSGAEPVGVLLTILLPPKVREIALKRIMTQVEEGMCQSRIQIMGGHTEVTRLLHSRSSRSAALVKSKMAGSFHRWCETGNGYFS